MPYQKTWQKRCDIKFCENANNQFVTFFPTPKEPNLFKQWQEAVQCTGTILPLNGRVCEKHFRPKDIMEFTCAKKLPEGSKASNKSENIKLRVPIDGAVPSRFEDEIEQYCKKELNIDESILNAPIIIVEQNPEIEEPLVSDVKSIKSDADNIVSMSNDRSLFSVPIKKIVRPPGAKPKKTKASAQIVKNSTPNKETADSEYGDISDSSLITSNPEETSVAKKQLVPSAEIKKPKVANNEKESSIQIIKVRSMKDTFFEKIYKGLIEPRLPNRAWNIHNCEYPQKGIVFAELAELSSDPRVPPILKKSVFFDENFSVRIYFFGKLFPNVDYEPPKGINDVEEFLQQIDALKICEGGPHLTELSNSKFAFRDEAIYKWRHNNCELRLEKGQVCKNCSLLNKTVGQRNIDLLTMSHTPAKRIRLDLNEGDENTHIND